MWPEHTSLGRQACPTRDRSRVWYRINLRKQITQRNYSKKELITALPLKQQLISGEVRISIPKCP